MNFQELLNPSWWFGVRPGPLQSGFGEGLLIGLPVFCMVLAIVAVVVYAQKAKAPMVKKLAGSFIRFGLTLGIFGFTLLFFRTQEIPFLAMRFFWALWILGGIVWAVFLIRRGIGIPQQLNVHKKRQEEFL